MTYNWILVNMPTQKPKKPPLPDGTGKFLTGKHLAKFWERIEVLGEEDCWEWTRAKHRFGYGMMRVNTVLHTAHRLAYMDYMGQIPDGLVVRHKCDNPACCNPHHLELGTQKDNLDDATKRGRLDRGKRYRDMWLRIQAETKAKRDKN